MGFHRSIDFVTDHTLVPVLAASPVRRGVLLVLLLGVTGLIVGVLLEYAVPFARGSGIPEVKATYLLAPGPQLSFRTVVGKFVLGALSIGAGFSLGREGPTVQICAGIGAAVGKASRLSGRVTKSLIAVGSAAGIAAAFNTPLAAITFALEEVVGDLNQRLMGAIVVASVAAAVIEHAILGGAPTFVVPAYALLRWWELLVYAALGGLCGLGATVFVKGLLALRLAVRRWRAVPGWAKPAIGGVLVAAIGIAAPQVLGVGYQPLSGALLGQFSFERMAFLSVSKLIATVLSYGWGLSGGIFAPTLFIGGMLGGSIGYLVREFITGSPQSVGAFALVGMGAFFAGAVRAPMTSILIIFEMTGDYAIILPLMISNMLSYTIAARLQPVPIYDALLQQDGIPVAEHHVRRTLRQLSVEQVMKPANADTALNPGKGAVTVFADQTLDLALVTFGRRGVTEIPVVTRAAPDRIVGTVSLREISEELARRDPAPAETD